MRLDFALPVPPGGYAWWYLDALSDDGRQALTVIAFVGSVFSPYYARARRRRGAGAVAAEDHCAINVALYTPGGSRWAMTERGAAALARERHGLAVGPSAVRWDGSALRYAIDETTFPVPGRLRGTIVVHPLTVTAARFVLDPAARHAWHPLAPRARVEVDLDPPGARWSGQAYVDHNTGAAPLESDFVRWDWSRAHLPDAAVALLYDVQRRAGSEQTLALRIAPDATIEPLPPPPRRELGHGFWRVPRRTLAEGPARVLRRLEDAPFYARSLIATRLLGHDTIAVHESLSLDRFASPVVQAMLAFRMPRRA